VELDLTRSHSQQEK